MKAQISGNLVTSGISDVAISTVHSEKACMKKMIMIIIFSMNKSQESTVFGGRQRINFSYETVARKVMVYFKFDVLYR